MNCYVLPCKVVPTLSEFYIAVILVALLITILLVVLTRIISTKTLNKLSFKSRVIQKLLVQIKSDADSSNVLNASQKYIGDVGPLQASKNRNRKHSGLSKASPTRKQRECLDWHQRSVEDETGNETIREENLDGQSTLSSEVSKVISLKEESHVLLDGQLEAPSNEFGMEGDVEDQGMKIRPLKCDDVADSKAAMAPSQLESSKLAKSTRETSRAVKLKSQELLKSQLNIAQKQISAALSCQKASEALAAAARAESEEARLAEYAAREETRKIHAELRRCREENVSLKGKLAAADNELSALDRLHVAAVKQAESAESKLEEAVRSAAEMKAAAEEAKAMASSLSAEVDRLRTAMLEAKESARRVIAVQQVKVKRLQEDAEFHLKRLQNELAIAMDEAKVCSLAQQEMEAIVRLKDGWIRQLRQDRDRLENENMEFRFGCGAANPIDKFKIDEMASCVNKADVMMSTYCAHFATCFRTNPRVQSDLLSIIVPAGTRLVSPDDWRVALSAFINSHLFAHFENEGYCVNGPAVDLCSERRAARSYQLFMELSSTQPESKWAHNQTLQSFVERLSSSIHGWFMDQMLPDAEASFWTNLLTKDDGLFSVAFTMLAKCALELHSLAFSFDPVGTIFRIEGGCDVDDAFMVCVGENMSDMVAFTVRPGFRVSQHVFESLVYTNPP